MVTYREANVFVGVLALAGQKYPEDDAEADAVRSLLVTWERLHRTTEALKKEER